MVIVGNGKQHKKLCYNTPHQGVVVLDANKGNHRHLNYYNRFSFTHRYLSIYLDKAKVSINKETHFQLPKTPIVILNNSLYLHFQPWSQTSNLGRLVILPQAWPNWTVQSALVARAKYLFYCYTQYKSLNQDF